MEAKTQINPFLIFFPLLRLTSMAYGFLHETREAEPFIVSPSVSRIIIPPTGRVVNVLSRKSHVAGQIGVRPRTPARSLKGALWHQTILSEPRYDSRLALN